MNTFFENKKAYFFPFKVTCKLKVVVHTNSSYLIALSNTNKEFKDGVNWSPTSELFDG